MRHALFAEDRAEHLADAAIADHHHMVAQVAGQGGIRELGLAGLLGPLHALAEVSRQPRHQGRRQHG